MEHCQKEAIIDEIHAETKKLTGRMHDGELRFQKIESLGESNKELLETLVLMGENQRKRLFVDNGTLSIQTKLDRNERFVKFALWFAGVATAASLTVTVKLVASALIHSTGGTLE